MSCYVKAISQHLGSVHVHRSKRGEPNLSGEIVRAERVGKEARTRCVEKERGGECPVVVGTGVEGMIESQFQSVLHGSLRHIQALIDSDFVERNLVSANDALVEVRVSPQCGSSVRIVERLSYPTVGNAVRQGWDNLATSAAHTRTRQHHQVVISKVANRPLANI